MSTTDKRRKEIDYRSKYLEKHKGFPVKGKYLCPICFKLFTTDEIEIDHIIPLSKYGVNRTFNCCALCKSCNREKGDKISIDVLKELLLKLIEFLYSLICKTLKILAHFIKSMLKYPFTFAPTLALKILLIICFIILFLVLVNEI